MTLNFPASPATGAVHNASNGIKYTYDGVKWTSQGAYSTGTIAAQKLDSIASSFNGSTKTFNLTNGGTIVNAHSAESLLISIAGVVKEPSTDYTVDVTAGTITFTSAPTNGQAFWGIVYSRLPIDLQTNLAKTGGTMTGNITFASTQEFDATKLTGTNTPSDNTVTSAKIADGTIVAGDIATGTLDGRYYTETELDAGQLDNRYYTETEADARFYNLASVEEIQSGETWDASDSKVATTKAIDARIIDLVDDVGGFVPIANETSFPNTNPDVNNPATGGTIVSIKSLASSLTSNGSGVATISNGNVANDATITINGLDNSTTYPSGFGMLVETTSTLHTYTFHRQTPKATEVTTVAGNTTNINTVAGNNTNINTVAGISANVTTVAGISSNVTSVAGNSSNINTVATNISDVGNFADLYQIATSAPSTDGGGNSLAAGDLWFDSSSNKQLKVHDGTNFAAISPTQSVLDDISIVSGTLTRQEDLGNITDSISSGSSTGALDTCATNITNINTFANVYRIASSAPSSSLDEGDLWYDSTGNVLKYYNGTTWTVAASAGLSEISEDSSPELGGHLDCNDKNLTEVATVSGDNLQIDFGTIA